MRVAVVSSGHVPSQWAHSVAVAKNANGFAQLGHDVDLLTVERLSERRHRREVSSVTDYYGIDPSIDVRFFSDRTPYYVQDVWPLGLALDALTYATFGVARRVADPERTIAAHCADAGVDLCYCRSYRAVTYAVERGVPTVMETHTPRIRKPSLKRAVRNSTSPQFRLLVTISERLKENFVDAGVPEEKVAVLQDGVDLTQFDAAPDRDAARERLSLPVDEEIVMYLGSLHADKGIEHVLRVAARLPDRRFQLVGGSDDEVATWRGVAADLDADNVHFSGYVENRLVPTYLAAADVLLMPYDTEREVTLMDLESTSPLKLFEYLASSRPVVSTDIPAVSRTVEHEHDALLATPNDIDELTALVERALDDGALADRLSRNAYETATRYSWRDRCERILSLAGVTE